MKEGKTKHTTMEMAAFVWEAGRGRCMPGTRLRQHSTGLATNDRLRKSMKLPRSAMDFSISVLLAPSWPWPLALPVASMTERVPVMWGSPFSKTLWSVLTGCCTGNQRPQGCVCEIFDAWNPGCHPAATTSAMLGMKETSSIESRLLAQHASSAVRQLMMS